MIPPNWRNTQTQLWHISIATILKRGVKKGFLHYNFQVYTERTRNMRQVKK